MKQEKNGNEQIFLNEDGKQNVKDQVAVLLAMLDDYKDRTFLPNIVKSRCREWYRELSRIHRAL